MPAEWERAEQSAEAVEQATKEAAEEAALTKPGALLKRAWREAAGVGGIIGVGAGLLIGYFAWGRKR